MKFFKYHPMFYVSLLWLTFPFYYSITAKNYFAVIATILIGIFYISSLYVENKIISLVMWIYMCIYIIVTTYLYSPANIMCFMYLSSLINYKFEDTNLKSFRNISLFLITITILFQLFVSQHMEYYEKLAVLVMISVCFFMHIATRITIVEKKNIEYITKQNEYINTLLAENERNRIGRDLHDTLGHVFAMLSLKSELALKLLEKEKYTDLKKELAEINATSKNSMKNVRDIISNLTYRTLKEELSSVKETLQLANINLKIEEKINTSSLNPTFQSTLSMVTRECVNNIIKHSNASFCKIIITEENNFIKMIIEDNGIGFKENTELKSINNRLKSSCGFVKITSLKNPTIIEINLSQERS